MTRIQTEVTTDFRESSGGWRESGSATERHRSGGPSAISHDEDCFIVISTLQAFLVVHPQLLVAVARAFFYLRAPLSL